MQISDLVKDIRSNRDFFEFMMNLINDIYKIYNVSGNFSDAKFCVDYLILHLFNDYDQEYIKDVLLFLNNENKDWDYLKIYAINLEDDMLYWALEKEENKFSLHEISRDKAKYYVKEMKGTNKEYIK